LPSIARIAGAVAAAAAITWCVAAAASIPTVVDGPRTLVAVEPLLQTLQLAYVISGTKLDVNGHRFPQPLVERDGMDMADAVELAHFLHLGLTKKNGVLVFSSKQSPDATQSAPPPQADLDALRTRLLDALNDHRRSTGRPPLRIDPVAEEAAQYQAEEMSRTAKMQHEDSTGRTPMQRYAAMGGRAEWYAENVGWYGLDVSGNAELWTAVSKLDAQMMAEVPPDDGHRENILSPQYDAVGIGVSVGPHGLYLAEDFSGE
jgi:uncharacterized protein YkwD